MTFSHIPVHREVGYNPELGPARSVADLCLEFDNARGIQLMRRFPFLLAFLIAFPAWSQTSMNGRDETGLSVNMRPTCASGDRYNATDTFQIFICGPTNKWVIQSVGIGSIVALKSALSDAIQYVSTNGMDSNDGRSLGTAKLTWTGAC